MAKREAHEHVESAVPNWKYEPQELGRNCGNMSQDSIYLSWLPALTFLGRPSWAAVDQGVSGCALAGDRCRCILQHG